MNRRSLIAGLGSTAAWPLVAGGQQAAISVIGLISSGAPEANAQQLSWLRDGLRKTGWVEDRNVLICYFWADGNYDLLADFAKEVVRQSVDVIVAFDNTATAKAAKAATSTIPIVFSVGTDPVRFGLVQSLNRPGGNITGTMLPTVGLGLKRLEVLRELLAKQPTIGLLVNPNNPAAAGETASIVEFAARDRLDLRVLRAETAAAIDSAFEAASDQKVAGILIESEPFFTSRREQIIRLAARHKIPAIDAYREFVDAGGLVSYGGSVRETTRNVGSYTGRILNGEKPSDLPVQQSTKVELILNLRTAKALGLVIPINVLARADEVIE